MVSSYSVTEAADHALFFAVAEVENLSDWPCSHLFTLVGRDLQDEVLFTGDVGRLEMESGQVLEIEITSEIPLAASRRLRRVELLTESQCVLAGIDPQDKAGAPAYTVEKEVKERQIQREQRRLWQERQALLARLDEARERGDDEAAAVIMLRIQDLEEQLRANDRARSALE